MAQTEPIATTVNLPLALSPLDAIAAFFLILVVGIASIYLLRGPFSILLLGVRIVAAKVDDFLYNWIAWLMGMNWREARYRRAHMLLVLGVALIVVWYSSALVSLPAVAAALIGILAIYRKWVRDEEDRPVTVPAGKGGIEAPPLSLDLPPDIRSDMLISSAMAFLFLPIACAKVNLSGDAFSASTAEAIFPGIHLIPYSNYVLGEFIRALPIFDWSEVYEWPNFSGVKATDRYGMHITFVIRVLFDLMLLAAIFRAFGIIHRRATGEDVSEQVRAIRSADSAKRQSAVHELSRFALSRLSARNESSRAGLTTYIEEATKGIQHPETLLAAARCIEVVGAEDRNPATLNAAVDAYSALSQREGGGAEVDMYRGNAYYRLWEIHVGAAGFSSRLQEAINAYEKALKQWGSERNSRWYMTNNNLGAALIKLAESIPASEPQRRVSSLNRAVQVLAEAAKDPGLSNERLGIRHNNIGLAYQKLSEADAANAISHLNNAAKSYQQLCACWPRDTVPRDWARARRQLAEVVSNLFVRAPEDANIWNQATQTVSDLEQCLQVQAGRRNAYDRINTQNVLGSLCISLGKHLKDRDTREASKYLWKGVAALNRSAKGWARGGNPVLASQLRLNLANAYLTLAAMPRSKVSKWLLCRRARNLIAAAERHLDANAVQPVRAELTRVKAAT